MKYFRNTIHKHAEFVKNVFFGRHNPAANLLKRIQTKCPKDFHGHYDYGGWTVCPTFLSSQSVVYSFGVGKDISFDLSLIEKYGLQVFAFDPTPMSIAWVREQKLPDQFNFYEYGIADYDGIAEFYPPENPDHISHTMLMRENISNSPIEVEVRRIGTLISMLGHRKIDVLKMDVEGAEYAVIKDIIGTKFCEIGQILIEFHHELPNLRRSQTIRAITQLNKNGYKTFHISNTGNEYSFIRH